VGEEDLEENDAGDNVFGQGLGAAKLGDLQTGKEHKLVN